MRLFQIKVDEINNYAWTENYDNYHEKYAKEREEGAIKVREQTGKLLGLGIKIVEQNKAMATVITEKQMTGLVVSGIKFELVREIPTDEDDPTDLNGVMRKFNRMAAKLMSLPGLQRNDDKHDCQNERVHVHMPGQALSTYNEARRCLRTYAATSFNARSTMGGVLSLPARNPTPDAPIISSVNTTRSETVMRIIMRRGRRESPPVDPARFRGLGAALGRNRRPDHYSMVA